MLDDPEPVVKLHNLGDSSVDFIVRPWCNPDDYWDVHWDITRAVKMCFDEEGISIPFPQRDVHFYPENGEDVDAGSEAESRPRPRERESTVGEKPAESTSPSVASEGPVVPAEGADDRAQGQ